MKKIYLIDASSFIYRMFYWLPELVTKSWEYVNSVYGMVRLFLEQLPRENPDFVVFIKDSKWKTFRHEIDENYKATRSKMPDNLRSQIPIIENIISKMWIPIIQVDWYEADDIIASLVKHLTKKESNHLLEKYKIENVEIDILSWDKDLHSLVSENVKIYDTMKRKRYWPKETLEKFWVEPKMITDYLAIVWDKSDNIVWIESFWPKKAVTLINSIWGIEKIYDVLDSRDFEKLEDETKKIFRWKSLEKLEGNRQNAFLSKKLASLVWDIDLSFLSWNSSASFDLKDYEFNPKNYLNDEVKNILKDLEFNSFLWQESRKLKKWEDLKLKVKIIWDDLWLEELFRELKNYKEIILDTETTSLNIYKARLVWVSIYLDDENIYYINLMHSWTKVSEENLKKFLKDLFDLDILVVGHNIKYDLEIIEMFLSRNNNCSELETPRQNVWQMNLAL